ncbi:MAG TPA: hypothetical protein VN756_05725 [Solirubrobacterales bacterium]|nr:hypothetical protein [Solirubrobacterales bacterium]
MKAGVGSFAKGFEHGFHGHGSNGQANKGERREMRKNLMLAFALAAVLSLGVAAVASAVSTTLRAGNLVVTFGGSTSPKALPKKTYTPVTTNIFGKITTSDGTHPSAFREAVVDIDKDVKVNVKGFPACKAGQLEARDTKAAMKVCGNTVLGKGNAEVEIAFPEQNPIKVPSPLTVFNGGESGGKVTLLIHIFITVPAPTAVVTKVTITRKGSGIHSVAKIPVVAGGSGSGLNFNFNLGKTYSYKGKKVGYFEAKCPDGVFKVNTPKVLFKNEASTPGVAATTVLKGGLAVPCTPKG